MRDSKGRYLKGHIHPLAVRRKIAKANTGKPSSMKGTHPTTATRKKMSIAMLFRFKDETNHPRWKGDNVGYSVLHRWVSKVLGVPKNCSNCGVKLKRTGRRNIEWANKNHQYARIKEDWIALCTKCHGEYDKLNGLRKRK